MRTMTVVDALPPPPPYDWPGAFEVRSIAPNGSAFLVVWTYHPFAQSISVGDVMSDLFDIQDIALDEKRTLVTSLDHNEKNNILTWRLWGQDREPMATGTVPASPDGRSAVRREVAAWLRHAATEMEGLVAHEPAVFSFSIWTKSWHYRPEDDLFERKTNTVEALTIGSDNSAKYGNEFQLRWVKLGRDRPSVTLEMFDDSWKALQHSQIKALLEWLSTAGTEVSVEDVLAKLFQLGFVDGTVRLPPTDDDVRYAFIQKRTREILELPKEARAQEIRRLVRKAIE